MTLPPGGEMPIASNDDVVRVRHLVRSAAAAAGLSLVDQTKIVTAASELARNTYAHGGGGTMRVEQATGEEAAGACASSSPTGGPASRTWTRRSARDGRAGRASGSASRAPARLSDEFSLSSEVGKGTTVTVAKWLR